MEDQSPRNRITVCLSMLRFVDRLAQSTGTLRFLTSGSHIQGGVFFGNKR
jgi:hypothetical protein